ncbi:efflux RND transporter periplasmic adaptor subunit [Pseudohalocynthiibacter aestuariivivens]|jgi:membrane fusion protein, multidrug efflux system|uniref:Efflux RND transporter periplasmic adaptor subunit n=1 Tax=Pseudohalocynthiibacter aestuariivivens TaxID=1591409 RepID=A0ABV5J9T2_9RHOB|nr:MULTISPECIES: efflux RND transporter periplasmic adaptor subunit [Pseudohalocynthiibacter]MBS9716789.1 efflux RND transporter periplasmic adaptor subunit [Pseudohalocynthiibacter aestuariivivens]
MRKILFLATALLTLQTFQSVSAQQAPPPVTVAKPVVKTIVEHDEFVGRFDALERVEVRSRVTGYLDSVHFKDGTLVEAGELLFSIDKREFQTALLQAEAQIDIAEASFDFSKGQLSRAESLIQNGNISQSVVDERRERHLEARGNLEQAKAALERAQIDYDYAEIRAPISGRIDQKLLDVGNLVNANATILTTIVSHDPIYFFFDIDERYYLSYARDARTRGTTLQEGGGGLEVVVTLSDESIPPISGHLDFSENRIDPATGTMRIRAVLGNAEGVLTPGLFGRVSVPGSLPYEGILVPDNAIVADQNRRLVMMVDEAGNVSPRPVLPGPKVDGYRVIREGLTGSETIVVSGIVRARPGAVVTPELVVLPPVAGQ